MNFTFSFFVTAVLFGVALAMDAFSVSLANGLAEPTMRKRKMLTVAGVFAGFQALMPMIGWLCVHTLAEKFTAVQKFIPWIAFALLLFLGGKMLYEGIKGGEADEAVGVGIGALMVQGVATSIDALSVGFTIAEYTALFALIEALIIAVVTFVICMAGIAIGRKFGTVLADKAQILGGSILILIGIKIFLDGIL